MWFSDHSWSIKSKRLATAVLVSSVSPIWLHCYHLSFLKINNLGQCGLRCVPRTCPCLEVESMANSDAASESLGVGPGNQHVLKKQTCSGLPGSIFIDLYPPTKDKIRFLICSRGRKKHSRKIQSILIGQRCLTKSSQPLQTHS